MDSKEKGHQKISASIPKELIQVVPSELRFPYLQNAMLIASCSVKLVNVTDNSVVFVPRYKSRDVAVYETYPYGLILPPRSTHEILVSREAKKSIAQSVECDDKNILYSTTVSESFRNSEYGSDLDKFYENQSGQRWHVIKLPVVPEPAYQQGSPDNMPHTEELIQVDPNELRFPFIPDESISVTSLIKVVNITDDYIVFLQRYKESNVAEYTMRPSDGILPPRSTQDIMVTRAVKNEVLQSIECDDTNFLFSTIVSEDFKSNDLPKFYETQAGVIWHKLELGVRLEVDSLLQPSNVMSPTDISSSIPKELIQVVPGVLRFPYLENAMLIASCSVKLVNVTDNTVVFVPRYMSRDVAVYETHPYGLILPPRSTHEILVSREAKKSAAQSIECDDKYILYSTTVSESFGNSEYGSDLDKFYGKQGGQIWHMRKLPIVLEPAYQQGSPDSMPHTEAGSTDGHMALQYLKDITNNFSNEIGRGGFGVVYKGVLGNGKMVAVKKLVRSFLPSSQKQFENEVNFLMKLKHENIVRLVGYCYETHHLRNHYEGKFIFAGSTECLLCLEFLPKGSLDEYISDASSGLDWPTRLKIEGISSGLQYLHEKFDDPIIHLDLKPGNILLDENMIPKITDFGLSRLFDKKRTIHTANASGTFGYMPPEYLRGIITPMSDVFSLGVIIMEVITGHKDYPYDIRTSSTKFIELELQKWRNVLQNEQEPASLEIECQQITRCIQIGLLCVNLERTRRPIMKKIIDMLHGLESMNWYISNELSSPNIQAEEP